MTRIIPILILLAMASPAFAAGGGVPLMDADVNLSNKMSLQRGARLFVNYCLSCHSAQYMRYNRMAEDLELSEDVVKNNMMFTTTKIGETMQVAMGTEDATKWLGAPPPDLSVIARAKGADYLFSYLNGFYLDATRMTGVNNVFFPGTAMPHVLWELQGLQTLGEHGAEEEHGSHGPALELSTPGKLSPEAYQQATRDLVAFMVYVGEPAKLVRYRIGFWVIVFLSVLLLAAYLMKREYWKDVH